MSRRGKQIGKWATKGGSNPGSLESRAKDAMRVSPHGTTKIYTREEIDELNKKIIPAKIVSRKHWYH